MIHPELVDDDWGHAFHEAMAGGWGYDSDEEYSKDSCEAVPPGSKVDTTVFSRHDVKRVIALSNGENDVAEWLVAVELHDGRFGFVAAGCDYTGWDCQAGGHACIAATEDDLIRFGIGVGERERLGLKIEENS